MKCPVLWLLLCLPATAMAGDDPIVASAHRWFPDMQWKQIVAGDFDCDGNKDVALLGLSATGGMVAIFVGDPSRKPMHMPFGLDMFDLKTLRLIVEKLDMSDADLDEVLGDDHHGYRRSPGCGGLNLGDDQVDSFHLFWDHVHGGFSGWRL